MPDTDVHEEELLFHASIPSDARFLAPVRDLAAALARYAGYSADIAREIAALIERAVTAAVSYSSGSRAAVDMTFTTSDGRFEIRLLYAGPPTAAAAQLFGPSSDAIESGTHAMDSIEFGRQGDLNMCRMVRNLPDAFRG